MAVQLTYQKSLKQRKWYDEYIKTSNATEAAMRVYNCKNRHVAKVIGAQNLSKLNFTDLLDAAGITDEYLNKKLKDKLEAKIAKKLRVENTGEYKVIGTDDNKTQTEALKLAYKVRGRLQENNVAVQVNNYIPILGGDSAKNALPEDNRDKQNPPTQETN